MSVGKHERGLLVVSYLEEQAHSSVRRLLGWAEDLGVDLARSVLDSEYETFSVLQGDDASYKDFIDRIEDLTANSDLKALDVFLLVHGDPSGPIFKNGTVSAQHIRDDLKNQSSKDVLRALYSSACYGASHNPFFIQGGFRVASGAVGVNANGTAEYPLFLKQWRGERTFKSSINAIPAVVTEAHDLIARALGFSDADSTKRIAGRSYTKITTPAD